MFKRFLLFSSRDCNILRCWFLWLSNQTIYNGFERTKHEIYVALRGTQFLRAKSRQLRTHFDHDEGSLTGQVVVSSVGVQPAPPLQIRHMTPQSRIIEKLAWIKQPPESKLPHEIVKGPWKLSQYLKTFLYIYYIYIIYIYIYWRLWRVRM